MVLVFDLIPKTKKADKEFRKKLKEHDNKHIYSSPEELIDRVNEGTIKATDKNVPKNVRELFNTYKNLYFYKDKILVLSWEEFNARVLYDLLPHIIFLTQLKRVSKLVLEDYPTGTLLGCTIEHPNNLCIHHKSINNGRLTPLLEVERLPRIVSRFANNVFLYPYIDEFEGKDYACVVNPVSILEMYIPIVESVARMVEIEMMENSQKKYEHWAKDREEFRERNKHRREGYKENYDKIIESMKRQDEIYEKWKKQKEKEDLIQGGTKIED